MEIRKIKKIDREWARKLLEEHWGSPTIVSKGKLHRVDFLPGFVALENGEPQGLLTYHIENSECELVSLNALKSGHGIGTKLVESVRKTALETSCNRLWLITTNDNSPALTFYQKHGFEIVAIHRGAIEASRKLKPEIPIIGHGGIPIQDEIEMEKVLP